LGKKSVSEQEECLSQVRSSERMSRLLANHSEHAMATGGTYGCELDLLVRGQFLGDLVNLFSDSFGRRAAVAHVVLDTKVIIGS